MKVDIHLWYCPRCGYSIRRDFIPLIVDSAVCQNCDGGVEYIGLVKKGGRIMMRAVIGDPPPANVGDDNSPRQRG